MEGFEISALAVLSDHELVNVYRKAIDMHLDAEFIAILRKEIDSRNLEIERELTMTNK